MRNASNISSLLSATNELKMINTINKERGSFLCFPKNAEAWLLVMYLYTRQSSLSIQFCFYYLKSIFIIYRAIIKVIKITVSYYWLYLRVFASLQENKDKTHSAVNTPKSHIVFLHSTEKLSLMSSFILYLLRI